VYLALAPPSRAFARLRDIRNARARYDTVLCLAGRVLLNAEDREALNSNLAGIKAKLEALGERF
jgi:hypothetical protein